MSKLNFFRFSIFVFALLSVMMPISHAAAATKPIRPHPDLIKEEVFHSLKATCDKLQDEQSCQMQARDRDCSWVNGKCHCVPETITVQSFLNSSAMLLVATASTLGGIIVLMHSCCLDDSSNPKKSCSDVKITKAVIGAGLVAFGGYLFSKAHFLKEEYKALFHD